METTSRYTPGPWIATGFEHTVINDAQGNTIVATPGTSTGTLIEMKANANLIAAAPEMLALLKRVNNVFYAQGTRKAMIEIMSEALPLIKKAEGRI